MGLIHSLLCVKGNDSRNIDVILSSQDSLALLLNSLKIASATETLFGRVCFSPG